MKKVVVTGAGGFLGGHLVNYFASQGSSVIAVFHREAAESFEHITKRQTQKNELQGRILPEYQAQLTFFDGDITSQSDMRVLFTETQPDTLIHAAALLVPPQESDYSDHIQYQQANERFIEINQSKVLADCAAQYQQQHDLYCLLVSTIYVFNLKSPIINEETEHLPLNLYAASKDEAQRYWQSKVSGLAVIYPPQIYGSHQFTPAIMPRLIRKMLFDESNQLTVSGAINPIHVNNLTKLIYSLCLTAETGPFCVNGDGLLTLEQIANSLQYAAQSLLDRYNMVANAAFKVSDQGRSVNTASMNIPQVDDSRLTARFKANNPDSDPHQSVEFTTTAAEMIESHWRHGQKTNRLMGLNFFGMKFNDCFKTHDVFTDDLRKIAETDNPTIIPEITMVCVLSGRTTALGSDADGLKREFDRCDDLARLYEGIRVAREISALRANKIPNKLTPDDCVISIFYNGRAIHNQHLKIALKRGLLNYPAERFIIRDICPENTIGQIQSFRRFLAEELHGEFVVAMVTSAYHTARIGRTIGYDSPQATNEEYNFIIKAQLPENLHHYQNTYFWVDTEQTTKLYYIGYTSKLQPVKLNDVQRFQRQLAEITTKHDVVCRLSYNEVISLITLNGDHVPHTNPLSKLQFFMFGAHKNEKRCGILFDVQGEHGAMQRYSSAPNPSISRHANTNVFFTDADLFVRRSFNQALQWGNKGALVPYASNVQEQTAIQSK